MKINRNNYEEFFLLYVDNELSAEERQEVELFVQQHADLAEELDTLLHLRLIPDHKIQFSEREILYRSEPAPTVNLNENNYEEYLLSYLDNELSPGEIVSVESFLIENPAARKEFELLQQTKLVPDLSVSFPDKKALYKTAERTEKIISISWWRIAAAAAILLMAGIWVVNKVNFTQVPGNQIAQVKENRAQASQPPVTPDAGKKFETNDPKISSPGSSTEEAEIKESKEKTPAGNQKTSDPGFGRRSENAKREVVTTTAVTSENTPVSVQAVTKPVQEKIKEPADPGINIQAAPMTEVAVSKNAIDQPALPDGLKTNYASEALMQEHYGIEITGSGEPGAPARKGIFRGLVRKANRVLNRVTDSDSDNKNSVRVASFQFALAK